MFLTLAVPARAGSGPADRPRRHRWQGTTVTRAPHGRAGTDPSRRAGAPAVSPAPAAIRSGRPGRPFAAATPSTHTAIPTRAGTPGASPNIAYAHTEVVGG